jgi:hypothetical protein
LFSRPIHDWEVERLVDFLRCCTLLKLEVRERIKCVGFQRKRNLFR